MAGYSTLRLESFKTEYICSCCSLVLKDPVQLSECGHHMCRSCFKKQNGAVITCFKCYETTPRAEVKPDRAFKIEMQTLIIFCILCNWTGALKLYQEHLDQTHPNPVCAFCQQTFSTVNDLNEHQRFTCDKMTVSCVFKDFGCDEMILRYELDKHYQSIKHQKVLMSIVLQMHSKTGQTKENTRDQLSEILPVLDTLSSGTDVLNEDVERLKTESNQYGEILESLTNDISLLKVTIQQQDSFINGIKTNQDALQQDVQSMKQHVTNMILHANEGTFTWKVTNVKEKIVAARENTQTSIYSPVFYSSNNGYKARLQLYLNGDDAVRDNYMSLFFVPMRGEYDAILKFPCDFQVILCLFDQTNEKKHIIHAFTADAKSPSFQRPSTDMNVPNGIRDFVSLKLILQKNSPYACDDTMYIKVIIDFLSTPASMFSDVFNLNPAMTTSMQQSIIREETGNRQA